MKTLLIRIKNIVNDRFTRILFYDQTLKKGYVTLTSFPKFFILRRVVVTVAALPLAISCWVVLVITNCFVPVRIYRFERPQRPGFASTYIEQLEPLCRGLQVENTRSFLVFIDAGAPINKALGSIYSSHFDLFLDDQRPLLRLVFSLIPRIGFLNAYAPHSHYNLNWELQPARKIGSTELSRIPEATRNLGLEPFKYVTISHPSIGYYKNMTPSSLKEMNRFIELGSARSAIQYLTQHGLRIVRVGVDTDSLPESLSDLPIIDLSGEKRTDKQDLWLFENCVFHWSMAGNGAWHFAHKFNRPTLVTDLYGKLSFGYQFSLYTFREVWDDVQKRSMTLSEMSKRQGVLGKSSSMRDHGLKFVQNSPGQILAAVTEVMESLQGEAGGERYDQSLLEKFDEILVELGRLPRRDSHTRPCISFLSSISEILK